MPDARLTIDEDSDGCRLDGVVRRRFVLPRSLVMKLIRTGRVRVNGARARPELRLRKGDALDVDLDSRAGASAGAEKHPRDVRPLARERILFEDADLVVADKPSGLVAHGGSGHGAGIVDALQAALGTPPDASFRPALANRLDRDTSGLIILARTPFAVRRINAMIRSGAVEKGYLALVRGVPAPAEGEVRAALRKERGEDGRERMVAVAPAAEGALEALTRYRVERRVGREAALLELAPLTGRTHQLRVHLAYAGHPIALDRKYGDAAWNRSIQATIGLDRLFLHASALAFPHPRGGGRVEVHAPLPADLSAALERLEARSRRSFTDS